MELVLFILIAGFLLLRFCSDKAASAQYDANFKREQDEKQRDRETWLASVTDMDAEKELQDFIYFNTRPFSNKKCHVGTVGWMSPELRERVSCIPPDILRYCTSQDNLLFVMMVEMGKLPWRVADWGVDCYGDNCTTEGRMLFQRQHQFLMWVDDELQRRGIEPMLFKKTSEPLKKTDLAKDRTTSYAGKYCWWSGRRCV